MQNKLKEKRWLQIINNILSQVPKQSRIASIDHKHKKQLFLLPWYLASPSQQLQEQISRNTCLCIYVKYHPNTFRVDSNISFNFRNRFLIKIAAIIYRRFYR